MLPTLSNMKNSFETVEDETGKRQTVSELKETRFRDSEHPGSASLACISEWACALALHSCNLEQGGSAFRYSIVVTNNSNQYNMKYVCPTLTSKDVCETKVGKSKLRARTGVSVWDDFCPAICSSVVDIIFV